MFAGFAKKRQTQVVPTQTKSGRSGKCEEACPQAKGNLPKRRKGTVPFTHPIRNKQVHVLFKGPIIKNIHTYMHILHICVYIYIYVFFGGHPCSGWLKGNQKANHHFVGPLVLSKNHTYMRASVWVCVYMYIYIYMCIMICIYIYSNIYSYVLFMRTHMFLHMGLSQSQNEADELKSQSPGGIPNSPGTPWNRIPCPKPPLLAYLGL